MTQDTNPIYFMHYRSRDAYGGPLSQGGATLAIRPMGGNVIRVAIAKCSSKDVFNKKLGRTIAEGRLLAVDAGDENNYVYDLISQLPSDTPVKEAVATVMGPTFAEMGLE